jgi:DNA-binding NarL/FixJ family response regulator
VIVDSSATERTVAAELRASGWVLREGWDLPPEAWQLTRLVCFGDVCDGEDARAALLAAARGAGVLINFKAAPGLLETLHEDLRRLGTVELGGPARGSEVPSRLDPEQQQLVELLAEGHSLDEIAAQLSYSRRTVNRRLRVLREALGVRTNAEAIARATEIQR